MIRVKIFSQNVVKKKNTDMERFLANFPSQRSQFTTIASQQHTHCSKIGLLEGNSNIGFWLSVLEHRLEHTVGLRSS